MVGALIANVSATQRMGLRAAAWLLGPGVSDLTTELQAATRLLVLAAACAIGWRVWDWAGGSRT
jgi:hypothetical protein